MSIVIGERLVTPSSIVFLLVKLRVMEPNAILSPSSNVDAKNAKKNDDIDEKFLNSRGEAEELQGDGAGWAHAPFWPGVCLHTSFYGGFIIHNLPTSSVRLVGGSSSQTTNQTDLLFHL
jgi:hypothetical protein